MLCRGARSRARTRHAGVAGARRACKSRKHWIAFALRPPARWRSIRAPPTRCAQGAQPAALGHPRGPRRIRRRRLRQPARSGGPRIRARAGQLSGRRCAQAQGPTHRRRSRVAGLQVGRRDHPSRQFRAARRNSHEPGNRYRRATARVRASPRAARAGSDRTEESRRSVAGGDASARIHREILDANRKRSRTRASRAPAAARLPRTPDAQRRSDRGDCAQRRAKSRRCPTRWARRSPRWRRPNGLKIAKCACRSG